MKKKLSALIVDDEEKALDLLKALLEHTLQFSEIRCANSAISAKEQLKDFAPDILFLDIKMPGKDGFTFLKELKHANSYTEVVFVTAYDQFVMQAIKNHAFDYLLKPVDRKELLDCITGYKQRKQEPDFIERLQRLVQVHKDSRKFRINTRTGYIFIDPDTILSCQADGNYTLIDLGDRQHLCSMQLGTVETLLPVKGFIRLGRSLVVNFNCITKVERKNNLITFEKEAKTYSLTISKSQLKELEAKQYQ